MPKAKKKFIDRKKAVTFNLVHRSQRDPLAADETAPQRVLVPVNAVVPPKKEKEPDLTPEQRREEQVKYGIYFDDDYNYLQHLKDTREVTMVMQPKQTHKRRQRAPLEKPEEFGDDDDADDDDSDAQVKKVVKPTPETLQLPSSVFASAVEEDVGLLNKAATQGLCLELDPEVVAALDEDFDFDDPDNQLEDNFIELAMGDGEEESEIDEDGDSVSDGDDSDKAFASDLDSDDDSDRQPGPRGRMPAWEDNKDDTKSRFSQYSMSSSVIRRNQGLSLLDNRFEKEDDILDCPLAETLAVDPGSEDEEEPVYLTEADLLNNLGDEEVEELEATDLDWSSDFETFRGVPEQFTGDAGPKIEGSSPSGLFTQLWDEHLMKIIARETNEYAFQTLAPYFETETGLPTHSRYHQWTETTVPELYRLLAVMMLMGMCVRGRVEEYWTTGCLNMPGFRKLMTKDRFLLLLRFLHFVDNNNIEGNRRLAKISPLLEYLNHKFKSAYTSRREISIDESLLLWKGRLSWVQCIRSKAARFGIKSYELCEAVSGYVVKIVIYTGKQTAPSEPIFGFTSSTAKIVLNIMKDYFGKGYCLHMDNFYNSVTLTRFLKKHKIDVVGTLNRMRTDTPADIKNIHERTMARGSVISRHCGDVSVTSWKDVKLVTMVSTYHNADMAPGRRARNDVDKPKVVHDYNKFMGGVDLKDQKLSMYLLERKRGVKWYIKVFRRLLNISILNAYIIYSSNMGEHRKMTHRQFRYKLVEELTEQYGHNVSVRERHGASCARLDKTLDHFPEHIEVTKERTSKQERYKRGRCIRCAAKKIKTLTNIVCSQCNVFLCVGPCWKDFHTREQL